jgi:hypothetical protein
MELMNSVLDLYYFVSEKEGNMFSEKVQVLLDAEENEGINLRQEVFLLRCIPNWYRYIRRFISRKGYDFKCLDAIMLPFVLRAYKLAIYNNVDYIGSFTKNLVLIRKRAVKSLLEGEKLK